MAVTIAQHNNIQANAMGVDYDGKYSVLGARSHIIFIDLNSPQDIAHRLSRQSKWDISNVQWNPCATKKEYFVVTYSQWADLWTFKTGSGSLLSTLRGHTRVISDVDWSPCEDNLIATCSIDTFIYVWDIRDTKRPKMTPSAVAGASQVKWNKLDPHLLATSHDGDIRIWDIRNGRTPMQYITAHLSKIYSLDWSPDEQNMLASSSQDSTVRFWDISLQQLSQASYQINAGAPVWKARYTPFGHAMVTALMPQMHRWDNSILLWNITNVNATVHSYVGHRNVVLDFGWRYTSEGTSAELVTWSKDHSLRLWKADSSILTQCGCSDLPETEMNIEDMDEYFDNINIASGDYDSGLQLSLDNRVSQTSVGGESNNVLKSRSGSGTFRPIDLSIENLSPRYSMSSSSYGITPSPLTQGTPPPNSLEREFKLMNIDLPNLSLENVDAHHRTCIATVQSNHLVAKLLINFPPKYPNNVIPNFQFVKPTNISQSSLVKFLNSMREVAQRQVRSNLTCLESCLRMLSNQVDIVLNSELGLHEATPYMKQQSFGFERIFGTYQDLVNIPFPRTSGARFCGAGHLVTFMRPTHVKGFEASVEPTPRCLATLMTFHNNHFSQKQVKVGAHLAVVPNMSQFDTSPTENSDISVKSFYYKEKKPRKSWKHHSKDSSSEPNSSDKLQMRLHKAAGKVVIQDLSTVMDLNRKLAEEYVVPTEDNYHVACRRNREAAEKFGRKDLVQLWSSLELIKSTVSSEATSIVSSQKPWASTSCGKKFLTSIIDHYSKLLDVQTLAMISCMFSFDHESSLDKSCQQQWHLSSLLYKSPSCNSTENESSNGSHRSNSFCENPSDHWWIKAISSPSNNTSFLESPTDSDYRYIESPTPDQEVTDSYNHENLKKLLDFSKQAQYDAFKQAYANILDRWKLMNQKTEILKYKSDAPPADTGPVFMTTCEHCNAETTSPQCTSDSCRKFAMICVLCQVSVKKLVSFCYFCGHGGHSEHMDFWFQSSTFCATGCGCECRPSRDKSR